MERREDTRTWKLTSIAPGRNGHTSLGDVVSLRTISNGPRGLRDFEDKTDPGAQNGPVIVRYENPDLF